MTYDRARARAPAAKICSGAAKCLRGNIYGGNTARRTTYVHIIRGSVYRKCAAYDKTDSLAVRAPRRHSRFHAVSLTEPP